MIETSCNVEVTTAMRPGSMGAWMVAIRPRTLLVAVSPVLVGATLGFERTGAINLVVVAIVFGAAVLMQIVTNMQNDVGYSVRGSESRGTRTGLPRATANGWLTVRQVRLGIVFAAAVAFGLGMTLFAYRGWPVLAIGGASLLAALAYMGGPKPIAFTPFGELTVFLFFGLVAVTGTDWVLTGAVGLVSLLSATAIGGLAAAALAVNNHRDMSHDRMAGRHTFAISVGEAGSRRLYAALLLGPFLLVPAIAISAHAPSLALPLLLIPSAMHLLHDFSACPPGVAFNPILFRTFWLEQRFAVLLSAGAVLARLVE